MLALIVALVSTALSGGDLEVDAQFPGGNILVEKIEEDTIFLCQDQRDTPAPWFYWSFRVRGAGGRHLKFQFTKGPVLGPRGPAVSTDAGRTWRWLETETANEDSFQYRFAEDAHDVRFSFAVPYQETDFHTFLERYRQHPQLRVETMVRTPKGREVELLRVGRLDGKASHRVLLTARHHSCESIANFVLEGILQSVLADSVEGKWLREQVEFVAVPFVDKDGVEDGDQGKLRQPYDHWLDYAGESRYASVRELRRRFAEPPDLRIDVALDLHCPARRDKLIYFATGSNSRIAAEGSRLSEMLEQNQRGPLKHHPQNNLPYGKGWNVPATYGERKSVTLWAEGLPGMRLAATIEVPYATVDEQEVTPERARLFGADLIETLRVYLERVPIQPR